MGNQQVQKTKPHKKNIFPSTLSLNEESNYPQNQNLRLKKIKFELNHQENNQNGDQAPTKQNTRQQIDSLKIESPQQQNRFKYTNSYEVVQVHSPSLPPGSEASIRQTHVNKETKKSKIIEKNVTSNGLVGKDSKSSELLELNGQSALRSQDHSTLTKKGNSPIKQKIHSQKPNNPSQQVIHEQSQEQKQMRIPLSMSDVPTIRITERTQQQPKSFSVTKSQLINMKAALKQEFKTRDQFRKKGKKIEEEKQLRRSQGAQISAKFSLRVQDIIKEQGLFEDVQEMMNKNDTRTQQNQHSLNLNPQQESQKICGYAFLAKYLPCVPSPDDSSLLPNDYELPQITQNKLKNNQKQLRQTIRNSQNMTVSTIKPKKGRLTFLQRIPENENELLLSEKPKQVKTVQ